MAKLFEQFFEQFGQSLPMYFISMYYKHLHIQYTKTFLHYFSAFLVPLHSGYDEQLQNSLPELMPFLAMRFIIGFPHFGHNGDSV